MVAYHLPFQQTPFLGRTAELDTIRDLLSNPDCRLLTLAGPGGIGKTRLAVEAVSHSVTHFADNCYFVNLAPLTSPDSLILAICSALQLQLHEGQEAQERLPIYLTGKHLLLVLDSIEQLLPYAVEQINVLIHAASQLHILVTSRIRLNMVEEWVFDVGGLDVPQHGTSHPIDQFSAVQLFTQCARRVQIGFTLTDQNRHAVIRICELVGGMPLGLELAATWLKVLSCAEIAEEIQRDVGFLATTNRNVPEKHRTMRAVLYYSWQLLSEEEQRVFRRLSLCRGFDREAAQVFGASLPMLSALVNKSLLTRNDDGRFHIHELLRQYASERLMELPAEQANALALHGEYFWAFLNERANELYRSTKQEVLRVLDGDIENIFMAWEWAVSERRYVEIQRLAPALYRYFWYRRLYQFGIEVFSRAVVALQHAAASLEQEVTLAVVLYTQSRLCRRPIDFAQGAEIARRALALLRPYNCPNEIAHALFYLAIPSNDGTERIALMRESLALCRTIDEPRLMATVLLFLAGYEQGIGQFAIAEGYIQESLDIARQISDPDLLLGALNFRIEGGLLRREYEAVYGNALEALRMSHSGNIWDTAGMLNNFAHVAAGIGQVSEAEYYYRQSMSLSLEGTFVNTTMESLLGMGCLLAKCGRVQQAAELLGCVFAQIAQNTLDENRQFYFITPNLAVLQADVPPDILVSAREPRMRPNVLALAAHLLAVDPVLQDNANHAHSHMPLAVPSSPKKHPSIEPLTAREAEVLGMIAAGYSNRQIADHFLLGISTVKTHINHLFSKLHVSSREEAIAKSITLGLLQ